MARIWGGQNGFPQFKSVKIARLGDRPKTENIRSGFVDFAGSKVAWIRGGYRSDVLFLVAFVRLFAAKIQE